MFRTVSDCLYFCRRSQPAKTGIQIEKCFEIVVQRLLSSKGEDLGGVFDSEGTEDASVAGAKQVAEKLCMVIMDSSRHPSAAKAALMMRTLTARLKSCPFKTVVHFRVFPQPVKPKSFLSRCWAD